MFRLQVKFKGQWRWGIVEYKSLEEADKRVDDLKKVGITARVRRNEELFEG